MRFALGCGAITVLAMACSAPGQKAAGRRYIAGFVSNRTLSVFPFDGNEVSVNLPTRIDGLSFAADGQTIYGTVISPEKPPSLVAVRIKTGIVRTLPGTGEFSYINSLSVNALGTEAIVSGHRHDGGVCGLFELDLTTNKILHIMNNLNDRCDEFLSSWSHLSVSPDGSRVVGTAKKGQLGVINVRERRVERLWSGTAGYWSPDSKWIATLSFTDPMEIDLIDANDLSVRRSLGSIKAGPLQWSPDSRYLLLWESNLSCVLSAGYFGTLQMLDVETGRRSFIESSKCRVNLSTAGWVSDDAVK